MALLTRESLLMGDYFLLKPVPPVVVLIVAGTLSGLVLFPLAIQTVLGLIGFSAIGPVAGEPH